MQPCSSTRPLQSAYSTVKYEIHSGAVGMRLGLHISDNSDGSNEDQQSALSLWLCSQSIAQDSMKWGPLPSSDIHVTGSPPKRAMMQQVS